MWHQMWTALEAGSLASSVSSNRCYNTDAHSTLLPWETLSHQLLHCQGNVLSPDSKDQIPQPRKRTEHTASPHHYRHHHAHCTANGRVSPGLDRELDLARF